MTIPKVDLLLQIEGLKEFVKYLPLLQSRRSFFSPDFKSSKQQYEAKIKSQVKIIHWQLIKSKINHYFIK